MEYNKTVYIKSYDIKQDINSKKSIMKKRLAIWNKYKTSDSQIKQEITLCLGTDLNNTTKYIFRKTDIVTSQREKNDLEKRWEFLLEVNLVAMANNKDLQNA